MSRNETATKRPPPLIYIYFNNRVQKEEEFFLFIKTMDALFDHTEEISIVVRATCTVSELKVLLQSKNNTTKSIHDYAVWHGTALLKSEDTFVDGGGAGLVHVMINYSRGRINIGSIMNANEEEEAELHPVNDGSGNNPTGRERKFQ